MTFDSHLSDCGHFAPLQSMADGPLILQQLTKYSIIFLTDALLILILYECAQKNPNKIPGSDFASTKQRFKIRKKC